MGANQRGLTVGVGYDPGGKHDLATAQRLLPGVLGDPDGAMDDSHASGLLEYPHYTRPADFRGLGVPGVLSSGHHAQIEAWRHEQALARTKERRPDLLEKSERKKTG